MTDPSRPEIERVAAYTMRHESVGRKSPDDACPRPQGGVLWDSARVGPRVVARRVTTIPKNVYRFFLKNTPDRVKSSPALAPVRLALALYRRHLKKVPPPAPARPWHGGPPNPLHATRWRLEASSCHAHPPPASASATTPRVAALVLNRNGARHLEKLFKSIIDHEDYPALAILVVDHASTDDSREVLKAYEKRLDLDVVFSPDNRSFSAANNDLARRADADVLLLLNNDIIFERPVIAELVRYLDDPKVGAVGCRLEFPTHHPIYPGRIQHAGIKFYADEAAKFFRPYNLSAHTGLTASGRGAERVPAVTAAFLLCRREDYFAVGGLDESFEDGYEAVDFCLRLRQTRGLASIVVHASSAIHDESATQSRDMGAAVESLRVRDRALFERRWGFALRRAIVADRWHSRRWWTDPPLRIGFAVTETGPEAKAGDCFTAKELAEALETELGAETVMLAATDDWYDIRGLDVVIAMVDRYDARRVHNRQPGSVLIAWARNGFDRWAVRDGFAFFDLCFVSSELAARYMMDAHQRRADVLRLATHPDRFIAACYDDSQAEGVCFTGSHDDPEALVGGVNEALRNEDGRLARVAASRQRVLGEHTYAHRAKRLGELLQEVSRDRLRIAIKVAAPRHETKHQWGDYHFALALRRAFERFGHLVRIDLLHEWQTPSSMADDVVLVLRGLSRYEPDPKQVNLMWNISHPNTVEEQEYEAYDHVFIASTFTAERQKRLRVPVTALLQCTDPGLFRPHPDKDVPCEKVLFVGNSRGQHRPIVLDAIEAGLPVAIYGSGWEGLVPKCCIRATYIANEDLHAYYRRASVVLNDHWPDMRMNGFLSNRLFDAAASGAILVSDPAVGLADVFGEGVLTYSTVAELAQLVNAVLADPKQARHRALALAERVRLEHTFARRAATIIEVARRLCDDRPRLQA